jgi:hypothetical protein
MPDAGRRQQHCRDPDDYRKPTSESEIVRGAGVNDPAGGGDHCDGAVILLEMKDFRRGSAPSHRCGTPVKCQTLLDSFQTYASIYT